MFCRRSRTRPALCCRASTRLVVARAHVAGGGFLSCMGEMTMADVFRSAVKPGVAIAVGLVTALVFAGQIGRIHQAFLRLLLESSIFFGVYLVVLLAVLRQMVVYWICFGKSGFYGSLLRATKMVRISTGTHSAQCYHSGWKSLRSMRGSYASECAEAASCGTV